MYNESLIKLLKRGLKSRKFELSDRKSHMVRIARLVTTRNV